jgi:hypothetical protein
VWSHDTARAAQEEPVTSIDGTLQTLDGATRARVRPALAWLRTQGASEVPDLPLVRRFLVAELPVRWAGEREQHEVAWALGDLFAGAGLPEQAALCRAVETHERLARGRWMASFGEVPPGFWTAALTALEGRAGVPARAALSLSSASALLEAVGGGLPLTATGELPPETVRALDDRFRWTEAFPWMPSAGEADIAPLRFLREHLVAQRLLTQEGGRLVLSELGRGCAGSTPRLWRAVVDPAPRWSGAFDRDALGVLAAVVLRSEDFALGRVAEQLARVLAAKWRPAREGSLFDGASSTAQAWYQLGVPLGWWDTGRGPADRRPSPFGRAAAVAVLRSVAGPRPG